MERRKRFDVFDRNGVTVETLHGVSIRAVGNMVEVFDVNTQLSCPAYVKAIVRLGEGNSIVEVVDVAPIHEGI
jgi:hypothetical protein